MKRLKVLIAPDKFKGTLTASAAAQALSRGWRTSRPQDLMRLLPISDGGDGFGAAISARLNARAQSMTAMDAAHRLGRVRWWWQPNSRTAIIESARVIGLAMLPPGTYHPFELDTFGLGQVLAKAAQKGARRCLVGLGGSATNDAGFGMARALGWVFLDKMGRPLENWTELDRLKDIEPPTDAQSPGHMIIAVDVENPLLGPGGATRVYGPQKGLRVRDFRKADECLEQLARIVEAKIRGSLAEVPGAGAAGGLGFGFMAFCGATLSKGFELFSREANLGKHLAWADLVLTGEGCIDKSTLMGKGVGQLAKRCGLLRKPCVAFGGTVTLRSEQPFKRVRALTELGTKEQAMQHAGNWLRRLAESAARHWP